VANRSRERDRVSEGPAAESISAIAYRLATDEDLPACTEVWHRSISDYQGRLNQPAFPLDLEPLRRLLAHLRATDPEKFWVATRDEPAAASGERVVGFGAAYLRGDVWFLAMLFVDPGAQARGLGRELLIRTFPGGTAPDPAGPVVLGTATDSTQPISNGLYAQYGMVPRLPVFQLVGRPRGGILPGLPSGVTATRFEDIALQGTARESAQHDAGWLSAVNAIDREVLGYDHPLDHHWLRLGGRQGFVYRAGRGAGGRPVGYAYTSAVGRVGPLAAFEEELLPAIAGHVLDAILPRGASSLRVSGASTALFSGLLRAGFRIEEFPALLCWTRPFADFRRYVPNSLALI
jgi:GNAT superfamily N-acetyltransferase